MEKIVNISFETSQLIEAHNYFLFVYAMKTRNALPWDENRIIDFYLMLRGKNEKHENHKQVADSFMDRSKTERKEVRVKFIQFYNFEFKPSNSNR